MARIGQGLPPTLFKLAQHGLTWLTGKPLSGQRPLVALGGVQHTLLVLSVLILSVVGSGVLVTIGGAALWAVPATVALTVCASRTLWLTDLHAAAHGSFSRSPALNRFVGDAVSLLLLVLSHKHYVQSHCRQHHGKGFTTVDGDDDAAFLHWLGVRPGMPKGVLWRRLAWGIVSPRTHVAYLMARLRVNLFESGAVRSLATTAYLILIALAAGHLGAVVVAVAWLLPITVLYQASSIVGWAGEHLWFQPHGADLRAWHGEVTHARFLGERWPADRGIGAKLGWWIRMLGVHLPCRLLVVPGDLPAHDFHHLRSNDRRWPIAIYARQQSIDAGEIDLPNEQWGIFAAIDRVFGAISALQPAVAVKATGGQASRRMLGM